MSRNHSDANDPVIESGVPPMSIEKNKSLIQRAMDEVFNAGDPAAVDQLYAVDFVNHTSRSMGSEIRGPEGVKANVLLWHTAFPDLHFTVEAELAEGDVVVSRWTATGTHLGPLRGIPATGRQVTVSALEMSRVADEKIAEQWLLFDSRDLLDQLGVGQGLSTKQGRSSSISLPVST
jgi:steroid delta-isomerase-like uncharacterized protein